MKSSTVIFSCVLVVALATLPFTSHASPLLSGENAAPQTAPKFNYRPSSEEGQFQFAQYSPYQQQHVQKKWSRLEPSIRFFKRSQPQQMSAQELANRFMLL